MNIALNNDTPNIILEKINGLILNANKQINTNQYKVINNKQIVETNTLKSFGRSSSGTLFTRYWWGVRRTFL